MMINNNQNRVGFFQDGKQMTKPAKTFSKIKNSRLERPVLPLKNVQKRLKLKIVQLNMC